MATVDSNGASVKTLDEYLQEIRQDYLDIDAGWNIDPESPDGQQIAIWSETLANLDEAVIASFNSVDPRSAVGQQLDRIALFAELTRQEGTFSTATVTFSGTNGTVIPAGTQVRNSDTGTVWETDVEATIAASEAVVNATCTTRGPETAAVGNLSILVDTIAGVTGVTNDNAASLGRERESDAVFRVRRRNSVARASDNQVDTMFALIGNVEGVNRVRIYENDESTVDSNGLHSHSILILVDGGDAGDIAAEIAAAKNPGTSLNRNNALANKVTVATETPKGSPFTATFFRPELTTIYVDVQVVGSLPSGTGDLIKQAIVDYANADLFDEGQAGFDQLGFGIGSVVAAGKLFTPANNVVGDGGYVSSIQIGTSSGAVNQQTVDPGFNGLAVFDVANIEVTISGS